MKRTNRGQKIVFSVAIVSYFLALVFMILAALKASETGIDNTIFASLAASVVFFVGVGVVLHAIATVSFPNFKMPKGGEKSGVPRDDE